jgi:nicotinate-nucleotide adenylyltransferase
LCLFGGAFDPPHLTHRRILEACRAQLPIDRIVVLPSGRHPFKPEPGAPAAARLELCRIAFGELPDVAIDPYEVEQPGIGYTVDTLRHFAAPGRDLYWVIGADNLAAIGSWREPEAIRRLCTLVVVPRAGIALHPAPGVIRLDVEPDDVASSAIRAALAAGRDVSRWVDPRVLQRIRSLRLYGC